MPSTPLCTIEVLVHTPAYSQMAGALSYLCALTPAPGTLVRVPLGKRELMGVVWDTATHLDATSLDPGKLRSVAAVLDTLP